MSFLTLLLVVHVTTLDFMFPTSSLPCSVALAKSPSSNHCLCSYLTCVQVLKDFSKGGDKSVYGVFTRDYRINALEARILVTVPACLEILLFSPTHREWVARLRYVIFDEVHCMREGGVREGGTAENTGTIWEHCLLLIRYPMHCNKLSCIPLMRQRQVTLMLDA